jgi:hypothetical protein
MITFKTLTGKCKKINYIRYKINWDSGCRSKFQKRVKDFLKKYWENDFVCEEFPVAGTRLTLDIYNVSKKIAIEVQGEQHLEYNKFFHGQYKNNYLNQLRRDDSKMRFCELNGIKMVEIYPKDEPLNETVFKNQDVIM